MIPAIGVERLARHRVRTQFVCPSGGLGEYLRTRAWQDMRRHAAVAFVAVDPTAPNRVLGFYTLSAFRVKLAEIPADQQRRRHVIGTVGRGHGVSWSAHRGILVGGRAISRSRPIGCGRDGRRRGGYVARVDEILCALRVSPVGFPAELPLDTARGLLPPRSSRAAPVDAR